MLFHANNKTLPCSREDEMGGGDDEARGRGDDNALGRA